MEAANTTHSEWFMVIQRKNQPITWIYPSCINPLAYKYFYLLCKSIFIFYFLHQAPRMQNDIPAKCYQKNNKKKKNWLWLHTLLSKHNVVLTLASSNRPRAFRRLPRSLRTQYKSCKNERKIQYKKSLQLPVSETTTNTNAHVGDV